jgi:hypothetical protein
MANINLVGDKLYNLNAPISVALIVGIAQTYGTVAEVPNNLRYPGKFIYDEDTDRIYIIDADKAVHLMNNVHIQVSVNATNWTTIQSYAGSDIKYIRFSIDGGVTYTNTIQIATEADLAAYNTHIANTNNPHVVNATQTTTISERLAPTVEGELLLDESHRAATNNPHNLTGDVINVATEVATPISTAIEALETGLTSKISKVLGSENAFPIFNASGGLTPNADTKIDANGNFKVSTGARISGSATTSVYSFSTIDDIEIGIDEFDLKLHDKLHITVNHNANFRAIAGDAEMVGMYFTIIIKGGTTGGGASFENIPWGADFDDIVLAPGDKWMVTGYVYSLNEYLVKAIEF